MTDSTHGQASRPENPGETERWERDKAATHGQDGQGAVLVPREVLRVLYGVYRTWMYDVGTLDPGDQPGIASLLTVDDAHAMDDATAAVERHEALLRDLLDKPDPTACPACATQPHDDPTAPHIHATDYGFAIYAPEGLPLVDQLRAVGYAAAVANLRDDAGYDAWARTQEHSWTRADYLEAVGPQKDQQHTEEEVSG